MNDEQLQVLNKWQEALSHIAKDLEKAEYKIILMDEKHPKEIHMDTFGLSTQLDEMAYQMRELVVELTTSCSIPTNNFKITSLHWEDLKGRFTPEEIAKLTNRDMQWVVSKMANAYLDGQYWNDLEYFVRQILDEREM